MATGVVVCVSSTRAARSPAAKLSLPTGPSDLQPAGSAGPPPPTESPLIWAQLGRRVSPSAVNANITDVLEAFAPEQQVPLPCEREMQKKRSDQRADGGGRGDRGVASASPSLFLRSPCTTLNTSSDRVSAPVWPWWAWWAWCARARLVRKKSVVQSERGAQAWCEESVVRR